MELPVSGLLAGASYALYRLTANPPARPAAPTAKLVFASRDLELGNVIRDGDIALADWRGEVPTGASSHMQDFIGRGVTTKIYAKEAILETRQRSGRRARCNHS